jgi:hypothetical protein
MNNMEILGGHMKHRIAAFITVLSGLVAAGSAQGQAQDSVPPGARSHGASWCVFVSGKYEYFLTELAKLIDMGGEVQGGYENSGGNYSALVCKRGKSS